ncbi:MAG: polymer-forming cytoskeletal protein [Anaerolineales bacterium]|nr:polymer-forming cytoskeletal protein [Chloroflexota bacterium]MBL6980717.1 polymer-forming cytoskeletal protein [Anaerolineales bacterium]
MKKHNRFLLIFIILCVGFVISFGMVGSARAFETDYDGHVPAGTVIDDDLLINGESVVIDGIINGNVFASATSVTLNGEVNGNLLINAGEATINGPVSGSVAFSGKSAIVNSTIEGTLYFAGVALTLESNAFIQRNLLFAGYSLETKPGSLIGIDVEGNGYQLLHDGEIVRDIDFEATAIEISGISGGDVSVDVGEPGLNSDMSWVDTLNSMFGTQALPPAIASGIRVSTSAQIGGSLQYSSPIEQAETIETSPIGGISFEEIVPATTTTTLSPSLWVFGRLREFVTLLAIGALTLWKLPNILTKVSQKLGELPLPSFGYGILTFLGGFVGLFLVGLTVLIAGILLSVVTMGGLARTVFGIGFSSLGVVFSVFVLSVSYGSKLVVSYLSGELIVKKFSVSRENMAIWSLVLGLVLYFILRIIPIIGALVGILATLFGLGAMWLAYKAWYRSKSEA